jgi:hypothetical protein
MIPQGYIREWSQSIRFRDINEMSEDKFVETHIPILRALKENKKMHID